MSKNDVTPSSMGTHKCPDEVCQHYFLPTPGEPVENDRSTGVAAAEVCDHFWAYHSPAGTKHGIEICEYCHKPNPADIDRLAALKDHQTLKDRIEALQRQVSNLEGFRRLVSDLSRCRHGRHQGDKCAGWRGPGLQDGGCQGGISLGNLGLQPGDRAGWTIDGRPITVPKYGSNHLSKNWYPDGAR